MPRAPRPWFRFYSETLENRKAQELGRSQPGLFFYWVNLLCLANVHEPRGQLPSIKDTAFAMRISEDEALSITRSLREMGFLSRKGSGLAIHQWDDWQKERDVAESKRAGKRDVSVTKSTPTAPESHARVEVEVEESKSKEESKREEVESDAPARDNDLPPSYAALKSEYENAIGFIPMSEVEGFREYCRRLPRDWISAAITQTKAAGRPSYAYLKSILQGCVDTGNPPSSIKPVAAPVAPKPKSLRYQEAAV